MPANQQIAAVIWALGIGIVWFIVVWLIVSNAWYRSASGDNVPETDVKPTPIGMVDEYPEGLSEAHGAPTVFLKVLIVSFVIWTAGYVAFFFFLKWPLA